MPELDEGRRTRIIESLDRWNVLSGSYDIFLDQLRPLLRPNGPTRILDLASGHAGFALHLLRVARDQGLDLKVTATDRSPEYLEVGRARAVAEGLDLRIRVQDALDRRNLKPGEFDIVTCTQAQHHFPAGLVAVMFETAARAAGQGVVFIDGSRSALHAIAMTTMGQLWFRHRDFTRDSVTSLRLCPGKEPSLYRVTTLLLGYLPQIVSNLGTRYLRETLIAFEAALWSEGTNPNPGRPYTVEKYAREVCMVAHRSPVPKGGNRVPWKLPQNYVRDMLTMRRRLVDDGVMQFR